MNKLSEIERKALALHELMKREQEHYAQRIQDQVAISNMDTAALKELVYGKEN